MNEYSKSKDKFDEKYKSTIATMQKEFLKEYDASIKENTLDDIDDLEDTEIINKSKDSLNELSSLHESEKEYTFSKDSESKNIYRK